MLNTFFDIVKYLIERRDKFKDEALSKDLIQLYKIIEKCHLAYGELSDKSRLKDRRILKYYHKESLNELKNIFTKLVKYFEITGEVGLISNLKVYVALESYESDRFYNNYDSINEHLEVIVNNNEVAGDFERTRLLLKEYISENMDKNTIYKHI